MKPATEDIIRQIGELVYQRTIDLLEKYDCWQADESRKITRQTPERATRRDRGI